ncbi:MAG: hypothetical protein AAGA45_00235 [Verrucomicrobiota bacterium]
MPVIDVRVSPVFIATFSDLVEKLARHANLQLAVQVYGPDSEDEELLLAWQEGLLTSVAEDCQALVVLLKDTGLGQQPVNLNEGDAYAVLRACSAIRLKTQQLFFKQLSNESLEQGEIEFHKLDPEMQQLYSCYCFLAGVQETLIAQLDPSSSSQ